MELKPGYQTSEGQLTAITLVISGLTAFGIIEPKDVPTASALLVQGFSAIAGLVALVTYVYFRIKLKREALTVLPQIPTTPITASEINNAINAIQPSVKADVPSDGSSVADLVPSPAVFPQ